MQRPPLAAPFSLQVRLLGGFRVTVGNRDVPETHWARRPARTIVKLLALQPDHRLHREVLLDTLWPDADLDQALNAFHKCLHAARRALEPELVAGRASAFLHTEGEMISLQASDGLWIDAETFASAAALARREPARDRLRAAMALYTGDLLPEDRYEEWAARPRESLQAQYLDLLRSMAALDEREGRYADAMEHLRHILTVDPLAEDAHATLMRLYALTGSRHQALRQFGRLRQALDRELGSVPDSTTIRLYEDIAAGRFPGT